MVNSLELLYAISATSHDGALDCILRVATVLSTQTLLVHKNHLLLVFDLVTRVVMLLVIHSLRHCKVAYCVYLIMRRISGVTVLGHESGSLRVTANIVVQSGIARHFATNITLAFSSSSMSSS